MHPILLYLLKMIGYSGVLLLYYHLFLRDKQYHQYNRYYLLCTVVLSLLLPLIQIPVFWNGTSSEAPLYVQTIQFTTVGTIGHGEPIGSALSGNSLLLIAYLLISVALLFPVIRSVKKILGIRRQYPSVKLHNINFYETEEKAAPFSFFRNIFWNKKIELNSDRGRQVFRHELYHSQQLHSADLVFMQLVLSFAWFNPFFLITKKELTTIHEYLADQFAISGDDRHSYAEFIVSTALRHPSNPVTHHFFQSSLKRRIAMILKKSTARRFSYLERIMIIPLIAGLFFVFAFRAQTMAQEPVRSVSTQETGGVSTAEETVNTGTNPFLMNDTSTATHDPGKSVTLKKHQSDTIPQKHTEVTPDSKQELTTNPSKILIRSQFTDEPPLYIVDGVETETSLGNIKKEIKHVKVWKGAEAVKRFGEKGKNGVVVVTTTPDDISKRIEIVFTKSTDYGQLAVMKSYCKQRGIALNIRETKYNEREELIYLSFEVDCGDGFSGTASAHILALEGQDKKFGFYRDYSPNSDRPFGTGVF